MEDLLNRLGPGVEQLRSCFQPIPIQPSEFNDFAEFINRAQQSDQIEVFDSISGQLTELVKTRNPGKSFSLSELEQQAEKLVPTAQRLHYGCWFFYPWNNKLVHLLPEKEFIELRTDRNRNKITHAEQDVLCTKKIGVIGLSVGRSIAMALTQERVCGEIRLADFDELELSNLNRLQATVFDLGMNKTVLTARSIAELDPYLKVVCYPDGITEHNLPEFLTTGSKLDLLVEECDGLDIKIKARVAARQHGIPVIMDTNDRGMLDVERFDLDSNRPILHGSIDDLDLSVLSPNMTTEEKVPFVAAILGVEQMSPRMKASLIEVDNTLRSWPQLASSVSLGAAITTNVARRILLGYHRSSGRWWVDFDQLLSSPASERQASFGEKLFASVRSLEIAEMRSLAEQHLLRSPNSNLDMDSKQAEILVASAMLAPSGGNSQPWQFLLHDGVLFLFLNPERAFSTIDPAQKYAIMALGACIENMRIKATDVRIGLNIQLHTNAQSPLIARIEATPPQAPLNKALLPYLDKRCTNRKSGNQVQLPIELTNRLKRIETDFNSHISITEDSDSMKRIAAICGNAERIRMLNPSCHWDMFEREMRWTSDKARETRDGVDLDTLELNLSDRTGVRVARDAEAIALIRKWDTGEALKELTEKIVQTSSAVLTISVRDLTTNSCIQAGALLQRIWLECTKANVAVQPVSAPAYMGLHRRFDKNGILSANEHDRADKLYQQLHNELELEQTLLPFFLIRLSQADKPSERSLRRPLADHLTILPPHRNEKTKRTPSEIIQGGRRTGPNR